MAVIVREDVRGPTHKPAAQCEVCGCESQLAFRDGEFRCAGDWHLGPRTAGLEFLKFSQYQRSGNPRY